MGQPDIRHLHSNMPVNYTSRIANQLASEEARYMPTQRHCTAILLHTDFRVHHTINGQCQGTVMRRWLCLKYIRMASTGVIWRSPWLLTSLHINSPWHCNTSVFGFASFPVLCSNWPGSQNSHHQIGSKKWRPKWQVANMYTTSHLTITQRVLE